MKVQRTWRRRGSTRRQRCSLVVMTAVLLAGAATACGDDSKNQGPDFPSPKARGEKCATEPGGGSELVLLGSVTPAYQPDSTNKQLRFAFRLQNTSTWKAATDVAVTVRFLIDDEDVTEELGPDFAYRWTDYSLNVSANDKTDLVSESLAVPDDWADDRVETRMTCTVGSWEDTATAPPNLP